MLGFFPFNVYFNLNKNLSFLTFSFKLIRMYFVYNFCVWKESFFLSPMMANVFGAFQNMENFSLLPTKAFVEGKKKVLSDVPITQ